MPRGSRVTAIRASLKKSKAVMGLRDDVKTLRRKYLTNQKAAIDNYLAGAKIPSLHIGAYRSHIPGWLETDIEPVDPGTVYLDATQPFPVASETFAYIYTEHMIEHVPFADGLSMLKECRRVLKADGVLRVATPNLAFILSLYSNPDADRRSYINWVAKTCMLGGSDAKVTTASVINIAFHSWGHQFLYDSETLESALRRAGFRKIDRLKYNESTHENLRGIEKHGIALGNVEMAVLETMIFEAS